MAKLKDIIRGDSLVINLTCKEADGTPFDLTGYSIYFTAKSALDTNDDTAAAIQKTIVSINNPSAGLVSIELSPADMDVAPGEYFYDIQFKDANGNVNSLQADKMIVIPDVTRRA